MREEGLGRVTKVHRYAWLWEPLESDPTFFLRSMFGAKAVYLGGRMVLLFTARTEPWRGVLVGTERGNHASLLSEFPVLAPHPILPKWLYLPESEDAFEGVAERLVALAKAKDPRIGVIPKPKKPRKSSPGKPRPS